MFRGGKYTYSSTVLKYNFDFDLYFFEVFLFKIQIRNFGELVLFLRYFYILFIIYYLFYVTLSLLHHIYV